MRTRLVKRTGNHLGGSTPPVYSPLLVSGSTSFPQCANDTCRGPVSERPAGSLNAEKFALRLTQIPTGNLQSGHGYFLRVNIRGFACALTSRGISPKGRAPCLNTNLLIHVEREF